MFGRRSHDYSRGAILERGTTERWLLFIAGVTAGDETIRLYGDADEVSLLNARIGSNLRIDLNAGDDVVEIVDSLVLGNTNITTNYGDDTIEVQSSVFEGRLEMHTGMHHDTLIWGTEGTIEVGATSVIRLYYGDDAVLPVFW